MSISNTLLRGSVWRKWDLHIHSPMSAMSNQFPRTSEGLPDWEKYLTALEAVPDVAAVDITDYFSVEGYRKITEFKKNGRLSNISLILPNIELRLDNLVYRKRDESEPPRRLNLHVIFSDEVSPDDIEEHFLRELRFSTRAAITEFRDSFLSDVDGNKIEFADQLRSGKTEEDFNNWFYDVRCFSVIYSI